MVVVVGVGVVGDGVGVVGVGVVGVGVVGVGVVGVGVVGVVVVGVGVVGVGVVGVGVVGVVGVVGFVVGPGRSPSSKQAGWPLTQSSQNASEKSWHSEYMMQRRSALL